MKCDLAQVAAALTQLEQAFQDKWSLRIQLRKVIISLLNFELTLALSRRVARSTETTGMLAR